MSSGQDFVAAHYAPRASAYLESAVHSAGADLDALEAWVQARRPRRVLDLGCGGGHVTYRAAPHAGEVIACDVTADMLETVARTAAARGLSNVSVREGAAEGLPFEDGAFDAVLSRFSAHHWVDLPAGLREVARVLAPGAGAAIVDTVAPADPLLDTHLQAIELLRDPSHVRNYTVAQWVAALGAAGLAVVGVRCQRLELAFESWTQRTRTPALMAQAIRALQDGAPEAVRDGLDIREDGSFRIDVAFLEVRKPGALPLDPAGGGRPQTRVT